MTRQRSEAIGSATGEPDTGTNGRAYRGKPPEVRRSEQRERILLAARDVFSARGYADTGVEEIVAKARMSRTTFYDHYDNKEQCLLAVFAQGLDHVREALLEAVLQPLAPKERIRAEVQAVASTLAADPAMARVMLITIVGATTAAEQARSEAREEAASIIEAQLEQYGHWQQRTAHERHIVSIAAMAAIVETVSDLVATETLANWETIVDPVTEFVAHGLIP